MGDDHYISADDAGRLLEKVLMFAMRGDLTSPRKKLTREQLGVSIRLEDSLSNIIVSDKITTNYRFMVAEWLWMLYGLSSVTPLARYNSKMLEFSDDGVALSGAYGPKIVAQAEYVLRKLREDSDTRQAVMTIWERNPKPSKDIPCTVAAQFIRRHEILNAIWTMRSSDTWLGLKYDIFCFSQMLNYFAGCLGLIPGFLQINLGSSHIYEEHWEAATEFLGSASFISSPILKPPAPPLLLECLKDGNCEDEELISEPWLRYGDVLMSKTSAAALEILRRP